MQFSISFKFIFSHSLTHSTFPEPKNYVSTLRDMRICQNFCYPVLTSPHMQYPYLSTFKKVLQYFHSSTSVLPRQYWSTGKEVLATIKEL